MHENGKAYDLREPFKTLNGHCPHRTFFLIYKMMNMPPVLFYNYLNHFTQNDYVSPRDFLFVFNIVDASEDTFLSNIGQIIVDMALGYL